MCESVSVGMHHIACARVSSPHTSTPRCKPNTKCARLQITCPDAQAEATHPFPFSLWVQSPPKGPHNNFSEERVASYVRYDRNAVTVVADDVLVHYFYHQMGHAVPVEHADNLHVAAPHVTKRKEEVCCCLMPCSVAIGVHERGRGHSRMGARSAS
jgi:hypothetical protein